MKEHWKKENLDQAVRTSKSQSEVLIKLGLRAAGGNGNTLMKYVNLYNLDVSHFNKPGWNMIGENNPGRKRKIPIEECLVINSNYGRTHLKFRLYSEGFKKRECELCGQDEYWKGNKMSLILDHKNGVWNDNRLENLQIVCPNCNATLPTHCGKNLYNKKIKKIQKCPNYKDLKKELENKSNIELLEKYGNTHLINKRINDLKKLDKIKNSGINFKSLGWVIQASKIIGIKENVGGRWIKRVDPEFYNNCYKRKIKN